MIKKNKSLFYVKYLHSLTNNNGIIIFSANHNKIYIALKKLYLSTKKICVRSHLTLKDGGGA